MKILTDMKNYQNSKPKYDNNNRPEFHRRGEDSIWEGIKIQELEGNWNTEERESGDTYESDGNKTLKKLKFEL